MKTDYQQVREEVEEQDLSSPSEIVEELRGAIISGRHWYLALLEAMGRWTLPYESYCGREYHYLIMGEAFDWLVLAERLCQECDDLVPPKEMEALLFNSLPPLELTRGQFQDLIGLHKYRAYLNYWYGIPVEEALQLLTEEEARKARGLRLGESRIDEYVYSKLYGATQEALLKLFRKEKGYPELSQMSITEAKEFTYWLFKYRLRRSDKARVASDTRRAVECLQGLRQLAKGEGSFYPETEEFVHQGVAVEGERV